MLQESLFSSTATEAEIPQYGVNTLLPISLLSSGMSAHLEIADLASVCCQADMEVEKYVGSFVEDDDMEPTDQPVPLGEQGMEVVKDDPQRRIARCGQEQEVHCAL